MKRSMLYSLIIFLACALLVACGTSISTNGDAEKVTGTTGTNTDVTESSHENSDSDSNDVKNQSTTMELTYTFNGEDVTDTAQLISSSEQLFSLFVLPAFELVAEEPGKDVLHYKENQDIFMRIEMFDSSVNLDQQIEYTIDQLSVVSNVVSSDESAEKVELDNAVKLEAKSDDQIVTSYIFKGDNPWKVTMYTTTSVDYRDAFLEMAKTISAEN